MAPAKTAPIRTQYGVKNASALKFELPSFSFGSESIVAGTSIPEPEREKTPPLPLTQKPQLDTVMSHVSDAQSPDPLRSHPTTPGVETPTGPTAKPPTSNGNGPTSTSRSVTPSQASTMPTSSSNMSPPSKRPNVRKLLSLRSLSNSFSSHGRSDSQVSGMTDLSERSDFGGPSRSQTPSYFGRTSTGTYGRPGTSGGQSVAGSTTTDATGKPSLRKRVSGAFWNRRSSLMMSNLIDENEELGIEVGHTAGGKENAGRRKSRMWNGDMNAHANGKLAGPSTVPPPQLPEIGSLQVSKGMKDSEDGFLNSKDLFSGVRYKREVSAEEMAAIKKQRLNE